MGAVAGPTVVEVMAHRPLVRANAGPIPGEDRMLSIGCSLMSSRVGGHDPVGNFSSIHFQSILSAKWNNEVDVRVSSHIARIAKSNFHFDTIFRLREPVCICFHES